MRPEVVGVFIPIVMFIIIGLMFITYFYFRSRERQMLIDKGLDAASIKEFFERKVDNFRLLKIGVVIISFGLGVGIGMMLEDVSHREYWIPLCIFVFTGAGFVTANLISNKMGKSPRS